MFRDLLVILPEEEQDGGTLATVVSLIWESEGVVLGESWGFQVSLNPTKT